MEEILKTKVAGIVVTFHPDLGVAARIGALIEAFRRFIVVDNGSEATSLEMVEKQIQGSSAALLKNGANKGVGQAFNRGVVEAFSDPEIDFVYLLDQDSILTRETISRLNHAIEIFLRKNQGEQGFLGTNYRDLNHSPDVTFVIPTGDDHILQEVKTIISSGTLVSRRLWNVIGPMEEGLFIDHVDDEYCLRACQAGFKNYIAVQAVLDHRIGKSEAKRFLGHTVYPMFQSPFRWFYVARNLTILSGRYFLKEPSWVFHVQFMVFKRGLKMLAFENERPKKVVAILRGFFAAFCYRKGSL